MTWADFYLGCFLVGFILSAVSFLMGNAHVDLHHHGGGHIHVGDGHSGHGHGSHGTDLSFFNFGTAAAFLAWFGGAGFIVTRYSSLWAGLALGIATLTGLAGAAMVFWFVAKVLLANERNLDPADFDPIGTLGSVSSVIRADGIGEMIYSQQGTRRAMSARSDDGAAIPKGTEVVVTRYEKGIAYVRRWDELSESVSEPRQ